MNGEFSKDKLKLALRDAGLNGQELAGRVGVSGAAVSHWMSGDNTPRPRHVLQMALALDISPQDLMTGSARSPVRVSFRKKARHKISDDYTAQARRSARYLAKLAEFLPETQCSCTVIRNPHTEYDRVQLEALRFRQEQLAFGPNEREIGFYRLIEYLNKCGAILIPVPWGAKKYPVNGMHVALEAPPSHWLYLNIDTPVIDARFWVLHEIAHMLTPDFEMESEEAESFADDFAGAVLVPETFAATIYQQLHGIRTPASQITQVKKLAQTLAISPYTIYCEVNKYAKHHGLSAFDLSAGIGGATTNVTKETGLLSDLLFARPQPDASSYVTVSQEYFKTPFFEALGKYLTALGKSAGAVARLLDLGMPDALEVFAMLTEGEHGTAQNPA